VSRAGVVAKLAFFVLVVAVGVVIFSRDSRRALADRWAMHKCPDSVQTDVSVVIPWTNPKIDHCEGTPTRATCSVTVKTRSGRKTGLLKDWDCTKRHISPDLQGDFVKAALRGPSPESTKFQQDLYEGMRYVADKLRDLQEQFGEQGERGWLRPAGLGFRAE
jgi:hypothetical protein